MKEFRNSDVGAASKGQDVLERFLKFTTERHGLDLQKLERKLAVVTSLEETQMEPGTLVELSLNLGNAPAMAKNGTDEENVTALEKNIFVSTTDVSSLSPLSSLESPSQFISAVGKRAIQASIDGKSCIDELTPPTTDFSASDVLVAAVTGECVGKGLATGSVTAVSELASSLGLSIGDTLLADSSAAAKVHFSADSSSATKGHFSAIETSCLQLQHTEFPADSHADIMGLTEMALEGSLGKTAAEFDNTKVALMDEGLAMKGLAESGAAADCFTKVSFPAEVAANQQCFEKSYTDVGTCQKSQGTVVTAAINSDLAETAIARTLQATASSSDALTDRNHPPQLQHLSLQTWFSQVLLWLMLL